MGREERLAAARDAERALQLGADGERAAAPPRPAAAARRRVAARAADRERRAHDRVLAAAVDRPVVGEERVGDPAEPLAGLVVVERDRLVRAVAARHHERRRRSRRAADGGAACTGSITPSHGLPGRDRRRDRRAGAPAQEHDRPLARPEQRPLGRVDLARAAPGPAVISANGLSSRCLRARSRATAASSLASQARCQPPSPLTARIAPVAQQADRLLERHREPRPAGGAGRSARRGSAGRPDPRTRAGSRRRAGSRPSSCSAGRRARADDREARPALGAVDERVAVAAVGRVEQLAQAVVAGGDIGRNQRAAARRRARRDRELLLAARRQTARRRRASTRASDGASARSARGERVERAPSPSASITTPLPSLSTKPARPCRRARP